MKQHDWITVLSRRWCRGCNSFQVFRNNKWQDVEAMIGAWPGYSPTTEFCGEAIDTSDIPEVGEDFFK